jgi:hypothetical protein
MSIAWIASIFKKNLANDDQLATIPHSVKDIEKGESFFVNIEEAITVSGGVKRISFRTNGDKQIYFLGILLGSSGGQINGELWEGAPSGGAANGDIIPCYNKNRQKSDECDIIMKGNSTTVDEVIKLAPFTAGTGENPGKAQTGQTTTDPDPTILKANTNYTLKLTPLFDTTFSLALRWNER